VLKFYFGFILWLDANERRKKKKTIIFGQNEIYLKIARIG
jgi:hypothetical protein